MVSLGLFRGGVVRYRRNGAVRLAMLRQGRLGTAGVVT